MSEQPDDQHALQAERTLGRLEGAGYTSAALVVILNAGLIACVLATRGAFDRIFAEFKANYAIVTQLAISHGFVMLLLGLLIVNVGKEFLIRSHEVRIISNVVNGLLVVLLWAFYIVGLFVPLFELITKLS